MCRRGHLVVLIAALQITEGLLSASVVIYGNQEGGKGSVLATRNDEVERERSRAAATKWLFTSFWAQIYYGGY